MLYVKAYMFHFMQLIIHNKSTKYLDALDPKYAIINFKEIHSWSVSTQKTKVNDKLGQELGYIKERKNRQALKTYFFTISKYKSHKDMN